jgi:capsular polysaccharide biosynthesis protein
MSEQALDLRRSAQIVRRHKILVGVIAALGIVAGAGYAVHKPPMLTSGTLVVVPDAAGFATGGSATGGSASGGSASGSSSNADSTGYMATQVVIAHSDPVLLGALPHAGTVMSLATLRSRVQVTSLTSNVISISAGGLTAAQAEATANAVADSYVAYLSSASSPVGQVQARVLGHATTATGTPLYIRVSETTGIGVLAGALIGAIIALAIRRGDRRLRERDQIADSIGVPVLASVPVDHPRDAAGWAKLFEHYKPGAVDAWRLRKALHQLGLVGMNLADRRAGSGSSLAVLSLSSDRKALALGPQLAAFAASLEIPVALVVSPQQDENATATLYAACAAAPAPSRRSGNLLVTVSDQDNADHIPGAVLTVVVAVVDDRTPRVADTMRTAATVLGVSAGAATAEQLARVATSAAADGRDIAGILVADPDPADQTTGRMPQVARPGQQRMPTRMTSTATETRR